MTEISYKDWNPGLDNGHLTLAEVRATLPANNPEEISKIVRLFENPKSPISFKGAVSLDRHDCIHILLGRGLLNQDEAFVVGFTMGTSKNITKIEEFLFKQISMRLYPKTYRFTRKHMVAYQLGLECGKAIKGAKIYDFPFESYQNEKISNLREMLGISVEALKNAFRKERELLPDTKSSKRLPI
jgi:hypothetical protein